MLKQSTTQLTADFTCTNYLLRNKTKHVTCRIYSLI